MGAPPMGAVGMPGQPPMGGPPQMMGMMQGSMPMAAPAPMKGQGKGPPGWSCKVIIQAERLHPEFPSVMKVVGVNNMNIDHIRSQGNLTAELRGKGSGAIDPRTGQESTEQ